MEKHNKKIKNKVEAYKIIKSSLTIQVAIINELFLYESKFHKALKSKKYRPTPKQNKQI